MNASAMNVVPLRAGHRWMQRALWALAALLALCLGTGIAHAQAPSRAEPVLGVGDVVKMTVYQNPDLAVEARVSENGEINVPLIGTVVIGGLSVPQAQQKIEKLLRDGGFVLKPQVTIQTTQIRSSQISILGQVSKPGRFPIEIVGSRVSEMIAAAGGVLPGGADVVTLVGSRDGKPVKIDIDLPLILQSGRADLDMTVEMATSSTSTARRASTCTARFSGPGRCGSSAA